MPFFILFLFLLFSTPSFSQAINKSPLQVWTVGDRRWTTEEEYQYGTWVEENITEDFFIRYHIPVDCADVPYAIRTPEQIARLTQAFLPMKKFDLAELRRAYEGS